MTRAMGPEQGGMHPHRWKGQHRTGYGRGSTAVMRETSWYARCIVTIVMLSRHIVLAHSYGTHLSPHALET